MVSSSLNLVSPLLAGGEDPGVALFLPVNAVIMASKNVTTRCACSSDKHANLNERETLAEDLPKPMFTPTSYYKLVSMMSESNRVTKNLPL